jgi:catechol-2,3-dioxygenase
MTQVKRLNATAVHSVNRFVFSVPSLDEAEKFYQCFGLKTNRQGKQLDLYTHGHDHCWGSVHESGKAKRLEYLSFGAYAEDFEALKKQALMVAKQVDPHPLSDGQGFWLRDTDGNQVQLVIGNKVTPNAKAAPGWPLSQPNAIGSPVSPMRSKAPRVQPQRLSHVLLFATDVPALSNFYQQALGLRMSDQSQDLIAFLHGAHSSDHHLLAMVKSEAPGLHHTSWAVRSIDEVGLGMEQMTAAGY